MNKIFTLLLFSFAMQAQANESTGSHTQLPLTPKWELGVGLGGLSSPHYRGSDQRSEYLAPIPYFRYNGKRLQVDKEGGRFYFYNSENIKLDISTAFALPVDSDDNRARSGMPDLDGVIELGPRLQFSLYQSEDKNTRLRFALPLRQAIEVGEFNSIGWVFSPYLQLRYFDSGWDTAASFGPMWASEKYHDYFYQVAPQYVTGSRVQYNASSGYSGSRLTITVSKRFNDIFFGLFARYDDLDNAVFIDSPLVKQDDSFMLGVVLSWVFEKSEKTGQVIAKNTE